MSENIKFTNPNNENFEKTMNSDIELSGAYTMDSQIPKKKKSRAIIWIVSFVIISVLAVSISFMMIDSDDNKPNYGGGDDYIGELHIEGIMAEKTDPTSTYQQEWLLQQVDYMKNDSSNKGIMLYVDSPGGEVYAADELYLKLMEYREETKRPIHAYYAREAASGAYYISAHADSITANRNCTTGSIGVYVGPVIDATELFKRVGLHTEMIKSSDNKAIGNYFEPFTDEHRAILQSTVDEIYERFVDIVAEGRNMDKEKVKILADGRIYTAKQAKEAGLIDNVGSLEDAHKNMIKGMEDKPEFKEVIYTPVDNFYSKLFIMNRALDFLGKNLTDTQIAMQLMNDQSTIKPMMMLQ